MTGSFPGGRRDRTFVTVVIVVLFVLTVAGLHRYGTGRRTYGRPVSLDSPQLPAITVSSPEDAYRYWKEQGFHGRKVVAVTANWLQASLLDEAVEQQPFPFSLRSPAGALEEKLNAANFLFVAAKTGIAREIVTVLPEEGYRQRLEAMREDKTAAGGPEVVTVHYRGLTRRFTTLRAFRGGEEPVLLYINASFFRDLPPERLAQVLTEKGVHTDSVVFCTASDAESASPAPERKSAP